jgi:hypothetical protein
MSTQVRNLSRILRPYRDQSSNFGNPEAALANHLPMVVTALAAMGANDVRLASWAATYALEQALRPAGAAELAGRSKWSDRIARDGALVTLASALATLGDGLAAAAFHAAIRAAYAVERGDDEDLASALESWEREFLALPVARTRERVSVADALHALTSASLDRSDPGMWLIADGMRAIGLRDGFEAIAAAVPPASALDDLALAAAGAFAASGNFIALHLMTGTHAFRVLASAVGRAEELMPAFWSAYAAAATLTGVAPSLDARVLDPLRCQETRWEDLLARAAAQDDDHVIKSTFTAWRLDEEISDPVFSAAAGRYLAKRGL